MSESKSALAINQTIAYGFDSNLVNTGLSGRSHLTLATSIREARYPYFFEGRVKEARSVARALLTLSQVVGARFYTPPNMLKRIMAERDPVITSGAGALRFEGFSACASAYARVDLLPGAFDGDVVERGTTNVDFNAALKAALASTMSTDALDVSVGKEEFALAKGGAPVIEKKVRLPLRWLKGFVEVQAYQARMEKKLTVGKSEALSFLRGLPQNAHNQSLFYVVPSGRGLRLSQVAAGGGSSAPVQVGGLKRLQLLRELVPLIANSQKAAMTVYASPNGQASEWKLYLDQGLVFSLSMTAQPFRGFSGEGQVLADLTEVQEEKLAGLRAALKWQQNLSLHDLSGATDTSADELMTALAVLGSRGLVGYDLDFGTYFHRELPFDMSLVENMHPRLKAAQKLLAEGGVRLLDAETDADGDTKGDAAEDRLRLEVKGSDVMHVVTLSPLDSSSRCTCQWFSKYQGARGVCKHILAARLKLAVDEGDGGEEESDEDGAENFEGAAS